MQEHLVYPKEAAEKQVKGTVFVGFIVEADGSITDPQVLKGIGYGCDEEALRVIKNMPRWQPGQQDGKAVAVAYSLPVTFSLE